jgi:putative transposase
MKFTRKEDIASLKKKYDSEFAFRYHRKSKRQPNHNYACTGTYFITINSERNEPFFEIPTLHAILQETWLSLPTRFPSVTLDEFVIMPTHVHFIIHMEGNVEKPVTLGNIIGAYKSLTTRAWLNHIKSTGPERSCIIWQRDFDDRAIIDAISLEARRQYIRNNPEKWESTHN